MKLNQHYDKLLHISITFMLLCFLHACLTLYLAVICVVLLQIAKVIWNYSADWFYHPAGDILANVIGFAVFGLYLGVG